MNLDTKAKQLSKAIAREAKRLGLQFVDGPNVTATSAPEPVPNTASGQERMGMFFSVSEA